MTDQRGRDHSRISPATLQERGNQRMLRRLSMEDREVLALATGTMIQYFDQEVPAVRAAEEQAALRAVPPGHRLEDLNGVNVGCGDRPIHTALLGIDVHKGEWEMSDGSHARYRSDAMLRAWADDLPFRPATLDVVVALHVLEHVPDPVATVRHWLELVKPGGGIGIVLPDWRYTWDARNDRHPWSHRWNPTPALLTAWYERHWKAEATLEHMDTYPFRLSFDVVLRKRGDFVPFAASKPSFPSGYALDQRNRFPHEDPL